MGHLNKLHEKYFHKGLRVIGLSDDPTSRIQDVMIDDLGAKYWIAVDSGKTMRHFGGGGIPHVYLVDAQGRVVGDMHPNEIKDDRLEELLKDAFVPDLGRELHPSLKSLAKSYLGGQVGKAWKGAARHTESEDATLAADARHLRAKCEEYGSFRRSAIASAVEAKVYPDAYGTIKEVLKDFAGMEVAEFAAETKKKLDADPVVKREMRAWKAYERVVAQERKAGSSKSKLKSVRKSYEAVFRKYRDTRAAELANLAARRLPQ